MSSSGSPEPSHAIRKIRTPLCRLRQRRLGRAADGAAGANRLLEPAQPAAARPARREPGDAARQEEHDQDEDHAEQEQRLLERRAQNVRKFLHGRRAADRAEPVVEVRVEDAAEHGAPARAGAADHDHQEQRQREVRRGHATGSCC